MAENGPRPETMHFKPNGRVPNSRFPVLLYRGAVAPGEGSDLADTIEAMTPSPALIRVPPTVTSCTLRTSAGKYCERKCRSVSAADENVKGASSREVVYVVTFLASSFQRSTTAGSLTTSICR